MADKRDWDQDIASLEALLADIERSLQEEGSVSEGDLEQLSRIRQLCEQQKAIFKELKDSHSED